MQSAKNQNLNDVLSTNITDVTSNINYIRHSKDLFPVLTHKIIKGDYYE